MLPSMKHLVRAALLLTASAALADSPLPGADVPAREVTTRTVTAAPKADEQLQTLTRSVESLESKVEELKEKVAERGAREVEFLDQTTHPLWP